MGHFVAAREGLTCTVLMGVLGALHFLAAGLVVLAMPHATRFISLATAVGWSLTGSVFFVALVLIRDGQAAADLDATRAADGDRSGAHAFSESATDAGARFALQACVLLQLCLSVERIAHTCGILVWSKLRHRLCNLFSSRCGCSSARRRVGKPQLVVIATVIAVSGRPSFFLIF